MMADLARREDVSDTIKRFGLDPSKPADVTAAYAYLWAEDHGPWLFDTPQTGPKMQEMAERVMRAARADPALFGRAVGGDDDAQREFSAAVAPPVPGSGIETRSDEERAGGCSRLWLTQPRDMATTQLTRQKGWRPGLRSQHHSRGQPPAARSARKRSE